MFCSVCHLGNIYFFTSIFPFFCTFHVSVEAHVNSVRQLSSNSFKIALIQECTKIRLLQRSSDPPLLILKRAQKLGAVLCSTSKTCQQSMQNCAQHSSCQINGFNAMCMPTEHRPLLRCSVGTITHNLHYEVVWLKIIVRKKMLTNKASGIAATYAHCLKMPLFKNTSM